MALTTAAMTTVRNTNPANPAPSALTSIATSPGLGGRGLGGWRSEGDDPAQWRPGRFRFDVAGRWGAPGPDGGEVVQTLALGVGVQRQPYLFGGAGLGVRGEEFGGGGGDGYGLGVG